MPPDGIIIIGNDTDRLADAVTTKLTIRGIWALQIGPGVLGDLSVSLSGDTFRVEGRRVGGVFFRAFPDTGFSLSYDLEDQPFCDAEVGATWLAAMQLDSVLAINRYDATAWFEGLIWPVWRRRLVAAAVPVSRLAIGDVAAGDGWAWYPYCTGLPEALPSLETRRVLGAALTPEPSAEESLTVDGIVAAGATTAGVLAAARALADGGLRIAKIVTDGKGRVLSVNPHPCIVEDEILGRVTDLLVDLYYAHLHRR
jgi:hypothetical protein